MLGKNEALTGVPVALYHFILPALPIYLLPICNAHFPLPDHASPREHAPASLSSCSQTVGVSTCA